MTGGAALPHSSARVTAHAGVNAARGATACDDGTRTKNGQISHADGMSIRPNALDRENGATQSSVRNHQASRGLRCVPRRSGSAANTLQVHLGLRSVAAPNCPAPLPVAAGLWLLGLNVPHRSR